MCLAALDLGCSTCWSDRLKMPGREAPDYHVVGCILHVLRH